MHNLRYRFFVASVLIFLLALIGMSESSRAQGQQMNFSVTGDVPYGSSEVSKFKQQVANHNKYSPSAVFVHVGDILSGGASCSESQYSSMSSMLKGLSVPAYIVPGDNETVDCKSPSSGMGFFQKYFKDFEQNFCSPNTERQSGRPENWAFTMDGVLFIGLNLVYGGSSAQKQAGDWVTQQLQEKASEVRATVAFAHYSPNAGSSFSTPFRKAAVAFGKPILFMHGHGHSWSTSYPFPEKNIFRVQVNKGGSEDPVQVTVTMNTSSPATAFVLKRKPWSSKTPVNTPPCANAQPNHNTSTSATLAINDVTLNEGNAGTTNAVFSVSLSNANKSTVTVNYQIVDGTATNGNDYAANPSSGTLTFPNGTTSQTISVSVIGDQTNEQDETFFVNLSNAIPQGGTTIADNQGVGTIVNDDGPPPNAGGSSSNLTLNKPITASSTYSDKLAANAVDGNTSTYWRNDGSVSSSSPPSWLRVDLGAAMTVGHVVVKWKENYYATAYEVQVSKDEVNWTTVVTATGASGVQDFSFSPVPARYVQLYLTKNMKSNYQVMEFEAYSGSTSVLKQGSETMAETAVPDERMPDEFVLAQNYPNPFNPDTQIRFDLPQESQVTIKVYTINGAEVRTLVNDYYPAGMHTVTFSAGNLPSGTYFYVMQAGEVRQVRRLMLVK